MIYYKSQKYNYKKALLIDIKKAYDSVNRNKLKEIIKSKFENKEALFLITFIEIYESLTMIINGSEINTLKGLPQGSALSPMYFNLYINDALISLNKIKDLSAQAYADDLILQSSNINILQKGYEKVIELYNNLDLYINVDKCELISDAKEDTIKDNNQNIQIIAKDEAKYLGQIINSEGIPTSDINKIQFGRLMNIISKYGELTKIAKIRIFLIYMKSKINHLIPLIAITGGIEDLWKTIRKIVFNTLLEHSTLPRESASAFGLGYYEIMVRPILKLRERNMIYTNNIEEDEMIGKALINILKYWLVSEPKHTDFVKEIITANIEGKRNDNYNCFDKIIIKECGDRLFRGHNLNEDQSSKLRRIKCPGLIVLISNESAHEIKERIIKINKTVEDTKKKVEVNKISRIIEKILTCINYAKIEECEVEEEIINNQGNITEQIAEYTIKEIKIRQKWKKKKEEIQEYKEKFVNNIININKNKKDENIDINEIEVIINNLREELTNCINEAIKEVEIGLELENMDDIYYTINTDDKKEKNKKPPGRPRKIDNNKNQMKIDEIFKNN